MSTIDSFLALSNCCTRDLEIPSNRAASVTETPIRLSRFGVVPTCLTRDTHSFTCNAFTMTAYLGRLPIDFCTKSPRSLSTTVLRQRLLPGYSNAILGSFRYCIHSRETMLPAIPPNWTTHQARLSVVYSVKPEATVIEAHGPAAAPSSGKTVFVTCIALGPATAVAFWQSRDR